MFRNWQPAFLAALLTIASMQHAGAEQSYAPVSGADIQKLLDTISKSDRLEVFEVAGFQVGKRIYASTTHEDLATLKESIRITPPDQWFMCMCDPSTIIRLYRNGKKIGELGIIGGDTIRFSGWRGDARITQTKPWFKWLEDRRITAPRQEYEAEQAVEEKERMAEARWMKAMPASIVPLWQEALNALSPGMNVFVPQGAALPNRQENATASPTVMREPSKLDAALANEYPDKRERVLKLFEWFGSGAGPWSGFPAYESVAEQMLLEYPTPELLSSVAKVSLTEEQTEGAARLFAGWEFNRQRPRDNALLPAELKRRLLEHSLTSTDDDKLGRAKRWLASTAP